MIQKRWSFGFGTIFSLLVVYFIYKYSSDKGWALLAFLSKWYLIIVGGLLALSLGILLIVLLLTLFFFVMAMAKMHSFARKEKKKKSDKYIDVEYELKE